MSHCRERAPGTQALPSVSCNAGSIAVATDPAIRLGMGVRAVTDRPRVCGPGGARPRSTAPPGGAAPSN